MDNSNYEGLDFDRNELRSIMRNCYADIIAFITHPIFQQLFCEMMNLHPTERTGYVNDVWLNNAYLKQKGMDIPEGILIQTSAFGDRRPTLFVVKKFLPEKYHKAWENVNWTFNNDFKNEDVPYDAEKAWRLPLSVSVQNAIIKSGLDLQDEKYDNELFQQELYSGQIDKSEKIK